MPSFRRRPIAMPKAPTIQEPNVPPTEFWQGANQYSASIAVFSINGFGYDERLVMGEHRKTNMPNHLYRARSAAAMDDIRRYWTSQAVFRGLDPNSNVALMELEVRNAMDMAITPDLLSMKHEMMEDYHKRAAKQRRELWEICETDEDRVNVDAVRFLHEEFGAGDEETKIYYLEWTGQRKLHSAAKCMGFHASDCAVPSSQWRRNTTAGTLTVVGRHASLVEKRIASIRLQGFQETQPRLDELRDATKGRHKEYLRRTYDSNNWEVTGQWHIDCCELTAELSEAQQKNKMRMSIHKVMPARGVEKLKPESELICRFHFGIVEGLMRFRSPSEALVPSLELPEDHPLSTPSGRRKMLELPVRVNSTVWPKVTYLEDLSLTEEPSFKLHHDELPSATRPVLSYVWRGLETMGEDEKHVVRDACAISCEIAFSENGTELQGLFYWQEQDLTCLFSGVKVGNDAEELRSDNVTDEWKSLEINQDASDYDEDRSTNVRRPRRSSQNAIRLAREAGAFFSQLEYDYSL